MIPIRTNKKIFKDRILNLNIPGKELNVNKIHRASKFPPPKKNPTECCLKRIYKYIYIYI